jgi:hypothetical protein
LLLIILCLHFVLVKYIFTPALTAEINQITPTESLIHLAISNAAQPALLAEIKAVMTKPMEGIRPIESEMTVVGFAYQCDLVMCTLDYQEWCDFINSKFGE